MSPTVAQLPEKLTQALELHRTGNLAQAQAVYEEILAIEPRYCDAINLLGIIAIQTRNPQRGVELFGKVIEIDPYNVVAHCNSGQAFRELKQWDAALASYGQAISLQPDHAEAYFNRGHVLYELKRWDAALKHYEQTITLKPDNAMAYSNRGLVLHKLKQWDAALASYEQAIALKSDYAIAYCNRGLVLYELRQWEAALASCEQAIALKADLAEAHCNRGLALHQLGQWDAALASYEQATALKANYAEAYLNRGETLKHLRVYDEALASYERALALAPDHPWLYGNWLHLKMHLCNWKDLEAQIALLVAKIGRAERAAPPFPLLSLADSAPLQQRAAEICVEELYPASLALAPIGRRPRAQKIRLGYYSADFRGHATAHLAAKLFERHDKERFHVVAFSFGPDVRDDMRKRLSLAFSEFIDVRTRSPKAIAQLSRELGIDIAVDLKGFTQDHRTEIFAHGAAPIQVSYLGYPGTMGAPYIDYIIADPVVIPAESRRYYTEKVVYLPNSYQVNDRDRRIADRNFSRAELGLPPQGFVFCCFNNAYKITPSVFDVWMRLLRQVEGSVLWLLRDNDTTASNLYTEAQARGVSGSRLIFARRMPLAEHLARHRAADLFLDTLPYNAHTTASDALWAGLPVLTQAGESFAARVAASLLNAVGLPELITTTAEQYEAIALALAADPSRLAQARNKLDRRRLTTPLFDSESLTRHLEQVYVQMYERYQQGLLPEDIDAHHK